MLKMRHFLIQSSFIFTLGCLWIPINSNAKPKNWITEDLSYWNVPAGNQKHNWYRVNKGILELRSDPERKHSVLRTKKYSKTSLVVLIFFLWTGISIPALSCGTMTKYRSEYQDH
jgi:hypothetical protein